LESNGFTGHNFRNLNKKAPELVKFKDYDARVDVYSLGVVIYEMGSGMPFLINDQKPV